MLKAAFTFCICADIGCFCLIPQAENNGGCVKDQYEGNPCNPSMKMLMPHKNKCCGKLKRHCFIFSGQYINGQDVTLLASMCKLKSGRLARETMDACLQYWGGMGFTNEVLVSRMYR